MTLIEEKLDQILGKLQKLDALDTKVDTMNSHFRKEIEEIKTEILHIKQESSRNDRLSEGKDRKFNLLLFGVQSKDFFAMNDEVMKILQFLVPNSNGNFIRDLWRTNRNKEGSPVIVKLNSILIKNLILKAKRKLQEVEEFKRIGFR
ncbi:hypothetical protein LSTR_LSTR002951 [Laodelphax striatellus]|uniref:Uncharacterized protein n=1 Tax=Laodelphax striatellus TaxID=195883 RepID=A0A482XML5_LAOST|nr:hypothetical protein LSTR_LSTR002951 [Laodelphax striatellus]